MDTALLVALISSVTSVILFALGWTMNKKLKNVEQRQVKEIKVLEQRQAKELKALEERQAERLAERDARREYEYKARLRLYEECEPLLFEIGELAERCIGRICRLGSQAPKGSLDGPDSWMKKHYFRASTFYRTLALVSATRLLRRRLTLVDLSLDPHLQWTYELLSAIEDAFTHDFVLAEIKPVLRYDPHSKEAQADQRRHPREYYQQGIPRGILGTAAASMLVHSSDGSERLMDYSDFEQALDRADPGVEPPTTWKAVRRAIDRIGYFYDDFHPQRRPVAWRILTAQVLLCRALLRSLERPELGPDSLDNLWTDKDLRALRWQPDAGGEANESSDAITAAEEYVRQRLKPVLDKVVQRRARSTESIVDGQPPGSTKGGDVAPPARASRA